MYHSTRAFLFTDMNLCSLYPETNLRFIGLKPNHHLLLFSKNPLQISHFRVYRRRRLKSDRKLVVRNQLGPFNPKLLDGLVTQFPSANSLEFFAPILGFVSGVFLYVSRLNSGKICHEFDMGDWILFTSPTPFNRFLLLRCPSFQGSELLEDVDEKLVKEERHYVRLTSGRVLVRNGDVADLVEKLEYQRVCVSTKDGGVISLDWPANLDLREEHGLDRTLLLIPGSVQGSLDRNIGSFVCEAFKSGCFPVVMNPRGCAGSPLTTARLFTAADSDDISISIQFINKERPWTTLVAVGWGYGANMLTKYLAEVGERTPLIAATCIDNPFDLEEASRFSPHHIAIGQKLTVGLIDILRTNTELFQGRAKGFDIEKALSAKSIHDFDKAISMVSHGFKTIKDFYSSSSTIDVVANVRIPVLFVQNDDGSVPLFSIPRSSIAENQFTSLLLCSCLPSSDIYHGSSAMSWQQKLTIEWLTAVELGLLKGHHPLLNDVDISINLSKGLALVEGRISTSHVRVSKLLDVTQSRDLNGYSPEPTNDTCEEIDTVSLRSRYRNDLERKLEVENSAVELINSVDTELIKDEEVSAEDGERGQVFQAAEVVINMLQTTMPGTIAEEEKKKVLTAVGQGETFTKALQGVVPDDVWEKLTTTVSGILHGKGTNLKINKVLDLAKITNVSSGLESGIQEKVKGTSHTEDFSQDHDSSNQMVRADDLLDRSFDLEKPSEGVGSEAQESDRSERSVDLVYSLSTDRHNSHGEDIPSTVKKETGEYGKTNNDDVFSKEKDPADLNSIEKESETGAKPNSSNNAEKALGGSEEIVEEHKELEISQYDTKEDNNSNNEEKLVHAQIKMTASTMIGAAVPLSGVFSEGQPIEKNNHDNEKRDNKSWQTLPDQAQPHSDSNPPTFNVPQALDALKGMDDSTQVAVNSVFGVLENMISQLDEGSDYGNEVKDKKTDSASWNNHLVQNHRIEYSEPIVMDKNVQSGKLIENVVDPNHDETNGSIKNILPKTLISLNGNSINSSQKRHTVYHVSNDRNKTKDQLAVSKLAVNNSDEAEQLNGSSSYITSNAYRGSLYNDYFHKHVLSKMPSKSLDLDTTTTLLLDYFPEDGQCKLLYQPGSTGDSNIRDLNKKVQRYSPIMSDDIDKDIELLYVILDSEKQQEPIECEPNDNGKETLEIRENGTEELMHLLKNIILDALKVEVGFRLSTANLKELVPNLARDLEQVANSVSLSILHNMKHSQFSEVPYTLHVEHIIRTISSAVQETSSLRRLMPVGVIVGSSIAALRIFFNIATVHEEAFSFCQAKKPRENDTGEVSTTHQISIEKPMKNSRFDSSVSSEGEKTELMHLSKENITVGAVTAALGASAFLVHHQDSSEHEETAVGSSKSLEIQGNNSKERYQLKASSEKNQNNIVTSFSKKAMSIASPMMPTNEDGEVDQKRLVAMLAALGQRGGILRLVGKVALLWGGLRGAMSLTDKLIIFFHIADRPLIQRIIGFVGMVLVLWSPVAVPLLPTLLQSWTANTPSQIAELGCIIGLYGAVTILVTLWGKRIRGFESPLEQYGLDLTSLPKIYSFFKGLIGGIILVLSIQSLNALLGWVNISLPCSPSSLDSIAWLKLFGKMLMLFGQGIVSATGVALVEELIFRSWLPEEIAADLGFHQGIIISGLAFSLFQGSLRAIPGLWLLSLSLAGARHRAKGSLSFPIGLRAGIMASSFVMQRGVFLAYKPNFHLWVTGTHPFQPFSGVIGFSFSLLLAIILYPRHPHLSKAIVQRKT